MDCPESASLPSPEVYEAEYQYWPWGKLIQHAVDIVVQQAPRDGLVLDYMCGTGYLLAQIKRARPDLTAVGCDINGRFVAFASERYPNVTIHHADAREFRPGTQPDVMLCTAGLHHLKDLDQIPFLAKMAEEIGRDSLVLIGEIAIGEYESPETRRIAALRLGANMIEYGIRNSWPEPMIGTAVEVLVNDVLPRGEYKRSLSDWRQLIEMHFVVDRTIVTWFAPQESGADAILICSARTPSVIPSFRASKSDSKVKRRKFSVR